MSDKEIINMMFQGTKEIDICLRMKTGMLKAGGSIIMKEINAFSLHQQKI